MSENSFPSYPPPTTPQDPFRSWVQFLLGIALVAAALYIGFWMVSVAKEFLNHPEKITLIDKIFEMAGKEQIMEFKIGDEPSFSLKSNTAFFRYFLFVVIAFWLLASIGRVVLGLLDSGIRALWNSRR